jgi:hypothetical protein
MSIERSAHFKRLARRFLRGREAPPKTEAKISIRQILADKIAVRPRLKVV